MSSKSRSRRRAIGIAFAVLIIAVFASPQFQNIRNVPASIRLTPGQLQEIVVGMPLGVSVRADQSDLVKLNGREAVAGVWSVNLWRPVAIEPQALGRVNLEFRFFGFIPFKKMVVEVVPRVSLVPGGQSIGVLLAADGVLVVGHDSILGPDGKIHRPALEAGIVKGDVILRINGRRLYGDDEAKDLIDQLGRLAKPIDIEYRHQGLTLTANVRPVFCRETGRFRVGLLIRDAAAGVGTLSFYDPESLRYAALGHIITDIDTNQALTIDDGRIVSATVSGIEQGKRGQPGEKIGAYLEGQDPIGTIDNNTPFGIGGKLRAALVNDLYTSPLPLAFSQEVTEGPAEILTVVEGDRLEKFAVQIQKVVRQSKPDTKGLVIRVTDPRLLARTGGIVQGMSGSPIIQDGRIVGAVTHVFVNDPARGYGVLAEWMAAEMGLFRRGSVTRLEGVEPPPSGLQKT